MQYLLSAILYVLAVSQASQDFLRVFSCDGRTAGYYADVATGCQQYHVCTGSRVHYTHTCPNNTLFQQRMMVCDHEHRVDCSASESFFYVNLLLGRDVPFATSNHLPKDDSKKTSATVAHRTSTTRPWVTKSDWRKTSNNPHPTLFTATLRPSTTTSKMTQALLKTTQQTAPSEIVTVPPIKRLSIYVTVSPIVDVEPEVKSEPNHRAEGLRSLDDNVQPSETRSPVNLDANESVVEPRSVRLEWTLPDVRAMLYIPDDPRDTVVPNIKRYSVTIPSPKMNFKPSSVTVDTKTCPQYCDERFLKPGTCDPCVYVK